MLTRAQAEEIALQAAEYPQHDEEARARLAALGQARRARDAADFAAFAAVDQAAYTGRIAAGITGAEAALEAAREAEGEAGRAAAATLRAERRAEDRTRTSAEHARKLGQAWERVRGRGTSEKQTEALLASQAAAQVAQGEQAAVEGAAASRAQADRDLTAARARTAQAEDALRAGQELAASPGRALFSPQTCAENVPHMVRVWDSLQPVEQQLVKNTIRMYAMLTGLYDEIKAKGGAEREAELEGRRPQNVPPFTLASAASAAGR